MMDSQLVWAPDATDGYVLGRVIDLGSNNIATIRLEPLPGSGTGTERKNQIECSIENVFPAELDLRKDYDDNCSLMFLNEANLLHNIRLRYFQNKIYTYVANILIALNPYHDLREQLYTGKILQSYQGKSLGKMPPHVFAIADKAYHDMKRMSHSQSIIVSGESGAGKTESTKYILRYICESFGGPDRRGSSATQIENLILEANPLLEAFGNAKTSRNNNSSRFGKFIEINFLNKKFTVTGGHISHYLLEKSRICGISSPLERNYHIFYQLCVGTPKELWNRLKLKQPDKFSYLNKGCTRYFLTKQENDKLPVERKSKQHQQEGHLEDSIVNDLNEFTQMDRALDHFGVTPEDKMLIYEIVAAVLHLGNVNFEESPDASHGGCRIRQDDPGSQEALLNAAHLLGVDPEPLQQCLQTRIMQTNKGGYKGSTYMVPLKVHEAQNARDALAKAIYSRLFDHIVMKIINRALPMMTPDGQKQQHDPGSMHTYIGVLDIAGFEYFQMNSFEQFCINYCNEKLQNFFNERILNDEQRLYENEGLGLKRIDYVDNHDCLELFESKSSGIFDLLDEESRLPKPLAQHFTEMVHHRNRGKFRLDIPRKSKLKSYREIRDDEGFIIRHFAGAVCYQTGQFIEKNNDSLHTNLAFLMLESSNRILKSFFQNESSNPGSNPFHSSSLADKSVRLNSESVGSKFRKQLADLIKKLDSTGTHFVRCIKPNLNMIAKKFDGGCILSQLKCSGMTSVLQLMQYGFPSRATYLQIYELYAPRLPERLRKIEPRFFCHALIKSVGLRDQDVRFGVTKVFFRPGRFAEFDMLMKNDDPSMLDQLVRKVQHWLIASRWRRAQWCTLSVIKLKNKILYRRQCIITIQKYIRMYLALKRYRPHFQSIKLIRKTRDHLQNINPLLAKIQSPDDRKPFVQELESLNKALDELQSNCYIPGSNPRILDKSQVDPKIRTIRSRIDTLISNLKQALNQQELRLKAVQEALELERRKQLEEETRRKEQEELRRKKAELEERKRLEMEMQTQKLAATTTPTAEASLVMLNEEERQRQIEYLTKLEQERRDYELALRLAQDHGATTGNDDIQQHYAMNVKQATRQAEPTSELSPASKKYKLESWNYAQLRDTINTSNDIELLEACREEFHRRLKVYHQWKYRTSNSNNRVMAEKIHRSQGRSVSSDTRAPGSVMNPFYDQMMTMQQQQQILSWAEGMDGGAERQRYFRLPFDRQCGQSKGIWYAHFDGKWIARQMEIHPEKEPILLVAGRDDLKMCELSLEETGLTRKRTAEILPEEFEAVWSRNGGQPYRTRSATSQNGTLPVGRTASATMAAAAFR